MRILSIGRIPINEYIINDWKHIKERIKQHPIMITFSIFSIFMFMECSLKLFSPYVFCKLWGSPEGNFSALRIKELFLWSSYDKFVATNFRELDDIKRFKRATLLHIAPSNLFYLINKVFLYVINAFWTWYTEHPKRHVRQLNKQTKILCLVIANQHYQSFLELKLELKNTCHFSCQIFYIDWGEVWEYDGIYPRA